MAQTQTIKHNLTQTHLFTGFLLVTEVVVVFEVGFHVVTSEGHTRSATHQQGDIVSGLKVQIERSLVPVGRTQTGQHKHLVLHLHVHVHTLAVLRVTVHNGL
jgi:hypothetical protein